MFDADEVTVREARIYLGSVAPTPWRAQAAEDALIGKALTEAGAAAAADAAVKSATPLGGNTYKVDLSKVVIRRAIMRAWKEAR